MNYIFLYQWNFSKVGGEKAGGLGEFETGSTNYITEGFVFGYDDGEECDETTEEDLEYLNDPHIHTNTSVIFLRIMTN